MTAITIFTLLPHFEKNFNFKNEEPCSKLQEMFKFDKKIADIAHIPSFGRSFLTNRTLH